MLLDQYQETFIYQFFSAYYTELLREKQRALTKAGSHLPVLEEAKVIDISEKIIGKLERFLRDSEEQALKGGGYTQSGYKLIQYALVALTDEIFLNLKWQGRLYWDKNILESRLFNTRKAGEKVFQNLNDFLEQNDTLRTDIAAVYLEVLALGFKGKYRGYEEESPIAVYMSRLYEFVYRETPKIYTPHYNIFSEAYAHTIEDAEAQKLPDPHRWYYYYLMGVVGFLLTSYIMWFDATFDLKKALYEVIQLGK